VCSSSRFWRRRWPAHCRRQRATAAIHSPSRRPRAARRGSPARGARSPRCSRRRPRRPDAAARARTLLGLLAHAHDDPRLATELLAAEPGAPDLEDWRLYVLADSQAAIGQLAGARRTLEELLVRHPETPLRPRALVRRVELAGRAGDLAAVRSGLARARAERLPPEQAVELERQAWTIGLDRGDTALLTEAGRHLLVAAPLEASKLRVVDALMARRAVGPDWRLWLTPEELVARAAALLAVDLPAGALTTLAAVPAERRDFAWQLADARALVAAGRGPEAHARLAAVRAPRAGDLAALEWERAAAAEESTRVRAGRALPAAERERFARLAREHLLAVVRSAVDPALAARALERLAASYLAAARDAEALAALRQLVELRPADTTGARPLWEQGWEAYRSGDRARARRLWEEVVTLYPETASARSARYWTARALEGGGERSRARALYLDLLAADTRDFYARQAALRLAGASATLAATPPVERESWPESPLLARARQLSDAGLDALAATEIELLAPRVDGRSVAALRGLVYARQGERRASLTELRRAFPELGTARQARVPATALALYYPDDYRELIAGVAAAEGIPAPLVFGIVHQESAFDARARSRSGARGLMQLMPSTGREVARKMGLPFSVEGLDRPELSVRLGGRYFRQMLDLFDGQVELALAGYNGGPGRISRLWRAAGGSAADLDDFLEGLPVSESRNYVKRILVLSESYRSLYPDLL
jgi:soluble lytic murein transglycosylase-like protein